MLIIYTPEGGERREWEYKPMKLRSNEAEAIERHTGWAYQEFGEQFMQGSVMARHALLFVLMRRTNPTLKYGDVSFALDEFDIDLDPTERAATIEALQEKGDDLTEEQREALQELIDTSSTEDADPKAQG